MKSIASIHFSALNIDCGLFGMGIPLICERRHRLFKSTNQRRSHEGPSLRFPYRAIGEMSMVSYSGQS